MTTRCRALLGTVLTAFTLCAAPEAGFAEVPRVLPAGQAPNDARLKPLKDLDGYFPFVPPTSRAAWEKRAERVRRQILVSQGLWPLPTKTPLNAVIHGRIEKEDYTVEKVYFESMPGFFVTGNLYRPRNKPGKAPGVLFAHGHWANARLSESGDAEIFREIADGEERFLEGGRSRFQSMCVQLARMGCVVWQWDMLGNADAQQLSMELVHGFKKQRPEMNTPEDWGLFSPPAEAHLHSAMGLQTWNAVRSLDFLLSLPEVDAERIAMTGASGGGTQTFILAAIDPRVKLAFPAVMVSTAMQGGCTCENASLLRVNTGNVEFAGLFAPKPQGLTTANDWTKEMAMKGFPELKQLYTLLGAANNVLLKRGEHFPHNYNAVSRGAFYGWLNKHFKLGAQEPVLERDYERLTRDQLTVWDAAHPAPRAGDPDFERKLLRWWHEDARKQLGVSGEDSAAFRKLAGPATEVVIGRTLAEAGDVEWEMVRKTDRGGWLEMSGLLRNKTHGEELPAVFCHPKQWKGTTVLWLSERGKAGLYNAGGTVESEIQQLLDAGVTVLGVDLLHQGEFLTDSQPWTKTGRVKNPRESAAYTFGYNSAVFAQRAHDVLTAIQFIRHHERPSKQLVAVGLGGAGPWLAAARAVSGDAIQRAVIDTGGFRFGGVRDIHSPDFLPGGAKYGDLIGMLAAAQPAPTLLLGETAASAKLVTAAFRADGKEGDLKFAEGREATQARTAAVRYLTSPGSDSP